MEQEPGAPVVLVSLEPRSYREAIGGALAVMRPCLEVRVVEPEKVMDEALASRPRLILSGRPDGYFSRATGTLWVQMVFPPDRVARVRIGDGPAFEAPGLGLEGLLEIVDGAPS